MVASRCTRPAQTCASRDQDIGAPISSLTARAKSSARALYAAKILCSKATRSVLLVAVKAGNAARAAATARSTSAALPIEICVYAASVAGLITSNKPGATGSTQVPLM